MFEVADLAKRGSEEERLLQQIDPARMPRHVAIIMDGNGRWARQRHLPRVAGHRAGIQAVRDTVETAARLELDVLTLYAFSQENWKRPQDEVDTLKRLLREYLRKEFDKLMRNNLRFGVIGRAEDLGPEIKAELDEAVESSSKNSGMVFNLALSYGGRTEIVDACRELIRQGAAPEELDEARFSGALYTAGLPDPDLLIRTSGELRVSNFLLWQIAYSEIWVTQTLWPDFRRGHLFEAILDYQSRERRYGGLDASSLTDSPVVARR